MIPAPAVPSSGSTATSEASPGCPAPDENLTQNLPFMRRREKGSFSSEDRVERKGAHVGLTPLLLTLSLLGKRCSWLKALWQQKGSLYTHAHCLTLGSGTR